MDELDTAAKQLSRGVNEEGQSTSQTPPTKFLEQPIEQSGERVVVNFVVRLEFQDGKRKAATQSYHGRGAVHIHALLWFGDEIPEGWQSSLQAMVEASTATLPQAA